MLIFLTIIIKKNKIADKFVKKEDFDLWLRSKKLNKILNGIR